MSKLSMIWTYGEINLDTANDMVYHTFNTEFDSSMQRNITGVDDEQNRCINPFFVDDEKFGMVITGLFHRMI